MSEPITNLEDAVAALGALPMPAGDEPQASPVVQPLALTEAQIEALVAAGDRVVNDAVHEDLCMCDAWPEKCVSTGNYFMGAWDVSGLDTALPAVLGLWESMRGGELVRLRAEVAALLAERHSTNESLSLAAEKLRENRDRITELEALTPAAIQTCRVCGAGYSYGNPCSNCLFRAEMAAELKARGFEDPHDSPLHHDYRNGRDLPGLGGQR